MATIRSLADVLQELHNAGKSGSLFINVQESSEDLIRIYLKDGEIFYLTYGSAVGQDCMDIIEYYTLGNATFIENLAAPPQAVPSKFPTKMFITMMRKAGKKVRVP